MGAYRDRLLGFGVARHGRAPRTTEVRTEGTWRRKGEVVGSKTEHADGRIDSTAHAPCVGIKARGEERRDRR